ncbi:DUF4468 domain-containing protein [Cytophagales bacterium LB-30]|uniref:DUF4468 domain-containing protein n=2 Tax=Shiella aurantiaca TaxID=3058365 RepID=A0ABT8F343_9BACT|nr:DUF4468 domain-containing protein [Shiella aurantiaca]
MEKRIVIIFLILFYTNTINAQEKLLDILPLEDGRVTYSGVVQVNDVSRSQLYNNAKRWFIDTYTSGKDVIQLDDKESGEIIGKGYFEEVWMVTAYSGQNVNVWQTIKVQMKDGRYRYEITDFRMKYIVPASNYTRATEIDLPIEEWNKGRDKNNAKFYPKIDSHVQDMISSLEKVMKSSEGDDW